MYEIVKNIEMPGKAKVSKSRRAPFGQALDKLEVGDGFIFDDDRPVERLYYLIAPKDFGGRKFKIRAESPGKYKVKRVA